MHFIMMKLAHRVILIAPKDLESKEIIFSKSDQQAYFQEWQLNGSIHSFPPKFLVIMLII